MRRNTFKNLASAAKELKTTRKILKLARTALVKLQTADVFHFSYLQICRQLARRTKSPFELNRFRVFFNRTKQFVLKL